MKEIHVVDGDRNWVKKPDGSWKYFEKPDEHSRTIALNKAQRNAICAHVPDKMIAQFIKKATADGRARQVPPDEVESHRQRKQVDSEEVTRIREQARRDLEKRRAEEEAEAPSEEEPPEGPPRSVDDVIVRIATLLPGWSELVKVSEYPDYYRVGRRNTLDKEIDDHVDLIVSEMGGEWNNDKNEWRIPKEED